MSSLDNAKKNYRRGEDKIYHQNTYTDISLQKDSNELALEQSVSLWDGDKINLIPMPSSDPDDPLNLPTWHKAASLVSICLFGAMAAAAELVLGAMLPVFVLQYAGINPKVLQEIHLPEGLNSLQALKKLGGPPIWKIFLLASLPVLMIGISNLFLVPLAITFGRRPVILGTGLIAMAGAVWAGASGSLDSHLAARAVQAVGAGTVESLIPFIISDMFFLHQRNRAISVVYGLQGLLIIALGIASPWIVLRLSWRWIYYITTAIAGVFWIGMFFFLAETRYSRSKSETNGIPRQPLPPGQSRPEITGSRSKWKNLKIQQGPIYWKRGAVAVLHVFQTFFYPHVLFITLLNSVTIAAALSAGYTVAPQLIAKPWAWPFMHLGFVLFAVLVSVLGVFVISGYGADRFANWLAKRRGRRDPEFQALNLIPPTVISLIGCILFGLAGDNPEKYSWAAFLTAFGFIVFGYLGTNSIGMVYVLECYPHLAGPALVSIGSFRSIITFGLVLDISEWIANMRYLRTFAIYICLLGGFILFIPTIFVFGERWRKRWPGPTDRTAMM